MNFRIRNLLVPILLVLAYATLMTGGHIPPTQWQMTMAVCQSLLLTFLTCYVGRNALYLKDTQREQIQAEKQLARARQILYDGVQQLPCAILLVDAQSHKLQFANHAAFKFFGLDWLPANQLSQRAVDEVFKFISADECRIEVDDPVARASQLRQQVTARDLLIKRPNGDIKQVLVTAIPLSDDKSQCASVMVLVEDITEHHRQLKQIENIAYRDPLTGLANRLAILQRIQQSFDRQDSSHFALLFMDFDRFKLINDSLGHDVGDQLLIEIGKRISQSIRSSDFVSIPARLGGDEFLVLLDRLPNTDVASQIADRILKSVNQPYHLAGHSIVSTASIGVVTSGHSPESASDMLRKADLAMYKSKAAGKARYSMFDESLKRQAEQRLLLESELRSAIEFDEFDFDIQPIVDLRSGENVGGEVFLRWQHPRLGRVSAKQFLDVACETGLIVPIGEHLLRKAVRRAKALTSMHPDWRLHINISRLQLLLPSLMEVLNEALVESGLDPRNLVLEVAELSVGAELNRIVERCRELKQRGVKICLDNFGAGASSLALLRELPLDYLKLDRSLIRDMRSTPESLVLLQALINLGDNYRIETIAEGIENDLQRMKLLEMGCIHGQGYAFSAPIEGHEFRIITLDQVVLPCG